MIFPETTVVVSQLKEKRALAKAYGKLNQELGEMLGQSSWSTREALEPRHFRTPLGQLEKGMVAYQGMEFNLEDFASVSPMSRVSATPLRDSKYEEGLWTL